LSNLHLYGKKAKNLQTTIHTPDVSRHLDFVEERMKEKPPILKQTRFTESA